MSEARDKLRFDVFLGSVVLHSVLATCDRLRTACGIENGKRLRGIGYNGSVTGLPHCDDNGHILDNNHCLATRHAEVNAITNTDRQYLKGATAIMPLAPCFNCLKDLAEEGIVSVDYVTDYENNRGKEHRDLILKEKGLVLRQHHVDWQELFQSLFNLLARKGGILYRAGYRLKVTKEKFSEEVEA